MTAWTKPGRRVRVAVLSALLGLALAGATAGCGRPQGSPHELPAGHSFPAAPPPTVVAAAGSDASGAPLQFLRAEVVESSGGRVVEAWQFEDPVERAAGLAAVTTVVADPRTGEVIAVWQSR